MWLNVAVAVVPSEQAKPAGVPTRPRRKRQGHLCAPTHPRAVQLTRVRTEVEESGGRRKGRGQLQGVRYGRGE